VSFLPPKITMKANLELCYLFGIICCLMNRAQQTYARPSPRKFHPQKQYSTVAYIEDWLPIFFGVGATTALVAACIRPVSQGNEALVERFGKFHKKLTPGWHLLLPVIDRVSYTETIREQILDVPPQQCYTKDNAPLTADAVVYIRIYNTEVSYYSVAAVKEAILNLVLTQLREEVGKLTLDETFSSRERINTCLLKDLNTVTQHWGTEITRVEVRDINPSPDIVASMELQMAAERRKRAAILESEGLRDAAINEAKGRVESQLLEAEAQKRATVLASEAESERMRIESQGLARSFLQMVSALKKDGIDESLRSTAVQVIMLRNYLETQGQIAGSSNTKVLMFPTKETVPLTYEGLNSILRQ